MVKASRLSHRCRGTKTADRDVILPEHKGSLGSFYHAGVVVKQLTEMSFYPEHKGV